MSEYDGTILFKDWLPDLPELGNPGLLEAENVEPYGDTFKSFAPLETTGFSVLPARAMGHYHTIHDGLQILYAGTQRQLYASTESAAFTALAASTQNAFSMWAFEQYDNLIIATDMQGPPLVHTLGSASNFSTLGSTAGSAPKAQAIGVIGQFVMLGNTNETVNGAVPHRVQWCGIDQPHSWPAPNSATAIAQQAGEQFLDAAAGTVTAISGGDQFGLIFQKRAVTRATYVGGGVVFQFDRISEEVGCIYPRSVVRAGGLVFFIAAGGVYATDGVQVVPIGLGKVNNWFNSVKFESEYRVIGGVNSVRNLVCWAFPIDGVTSNPDGILIYNWHTKRFSYAEGSHTGLITTRGELAGFGADNTLGAFLGTPGTAVLTTGEMEPNPAGYSEEFGIKPLVDATVNAITIAMGTRNDQGEAVSYSSEQTANARSGFANFRTSARYHRARLKIAGTFNAAQGLEYQANAAGYT